MRDRCVAAILDGRGRERRLRNAATAVGQEVPGGFWERGFWAGREPGRLCGPLLRASASNVGGVCQDPILACTENALPTRARARTHTHTHTHMYTRTHARTHKTHARTRTQPAHSRARARRCGGRCWRRWPKRARSCSARCGPWRPASPAWTRSRPPSTSPATRNSPAAPCAAGARCGPAPRSAL